MKTMFAHWQYTCLIPLLCLFACIKDQDASVENLLVINVDQDNAIAAWSYREKWLKADKEQRKPFGSLLSVYMASHYLNDMASALRYHYGTPPAEALALAWGGLDRTSAWNSLPAATKTSSLDIQRDHRYSAKGKPCSR